MSIRSHQVVLRAVGLSVALAALGAAVLALALPPLRLAIRLTRDGRPGDAGFPLLLEATFAVVLVCCTAWLLVGAAAGLSEAVTGRVWSGLARVTPHVVRRSVLLACGVALTGTGLTVTANADGTVPPAPGPGPGIVHGLPLPDRVGDRGSGPQPGPRRGAPLLRPAPDVVVVRPGDSLWAVAAGLLADDATDQEVDATWRAIYRANRPYVGDDPDLVLPGTALHIPELPHHRKEAP